MLNNLETATNVSDNLRHRYQIQIVTNRWSLISGAIRFSTRSWASHVEFVDCETAATLGARWDGVKERPYFIDHYSRIERFVVANVGYAYEWAQTQIGKPYDYSAITGIAFDRNWHEEDRWFCSELVAEAFIRIGYPILSTRPSNMLWRITPRDLLLSRQLIYLGEGKAV